jgi:hypothetical protein
MPPTRKRVLFFLLGAVLWALAVALLAANLKQPPVSVLAGAGALLGLGGVLMDARVFADALATLTRTLRDGRTAWKGQAPE